MIYLLCLLVRRSLRRGVHRAPDEPAAELRGPRVPAPGAVAERGLAALPHVHRR